MPNRASDLVWDDSAADAAAQQRGLTRARIVEAALALADEQGLDAVSIRRVAAVLDARPMKQQLRARADAARHPEMAKVFPSGRGASAAPQFDQALEVVLDGIEARFLR